MKKIYVSEEIKVFSGLAAEKLLNIKNDFTFYDESEKGVHRVNLERWETAQKYEKKTWMNNNLHLNSDRNEEHMSRFGNLDEILGPNFKTKNVIELGCGPFTNLKFLSKNLNPDKITLLDPLIDSYLNHPNCSYKNMNLNNIPVELISSAIENYKPNQKFDVVVMINVIEHCFDVDLIFENILNILDENGVFIFSDVYFDNVSELSKNIYDAGHPIKLSKTKLFEFLKKFNDMYIKHFYGLYSQNWRNDIYYIGKKI